MLVVAMSMFVVTMLVVAGGMLVMAMLVVIVAMFIVAEGMLVVAMLVVDMDMESVMLVVHVMLVVGFLAQDCLLPRD